MIDSNTIFDAWGVATLGTDDDKYVLTLTRRPDDYDLTIDDPRGNLMVFRLANATDVYNLGIALARLADVP